MVEVTRKDFKTILSLLKLLEDILLDVSEDKKNNYIKRKTALAGYKQTKELNEKFKK